MAFGLRELALAMVVLIVTVSIGAKITNTIYGTYDNSTSEAALVANEGTSSLGDFSDWFSIIVIAGVGGAILSLLMSSFGGISERRM